MTSQSQKGPVRAHAPKTEARATVRPAVRDRPRTRNVAPPVAPVRTDDACRERRAPQHARGQRRVDAILDTAAAIIAEEGMAGLTIDAIIKRSGTSKSSLYHFFPDLENVVRALVERHCANIRDQHDLRPETFDWAAMTTEEAVDRFLQPMRHYIDAHPDFLHVIHAAGAQEVAHDAGIDALKIARAERLLAARLPGVKPAQRRARAAAWVGMVVGTCQLSGRVSPTLCAGMMRELRQTLVAYLTALEASHTVE